MQGTLKVEKSENSVSAESVWAEMGKYFLKVHASVSKKEQKA